MKTYEKYKDSETDYLSELPSHWAVIKLKFIGSIFSGISGKKGEDFSNEPIKNFKPYIPFTNICNNRIIDPEQMGYVNIDEDENQNIVQKNDFLFLMSSETEEDVGKSSLYLSEKKVYLNSFCKGFRLKGINDPFFINYYLSSKEIESYFSINSRGFTRINLRQEYVKDVPVLLPPLPEQRQIAAYLDYKIKQIDRFIANRIKQIELFEEQATKVMENLLLVGTRKQEQKSIDFPYLDRIPASWEFMKLNHLANITRLAGYEYTSLWKTDEKGEIIALRGQNVGFNCLLDIENADRISNKLSIRLNRSRLYRNDIVFPCVGTVGKAVLIEEDNRYHINQNIAKITPSNKINPLYLTYILNSYFCYHQIIHFNTSDAQPNVLVRDLRRFMIPVPSIKEQDEIVQEINEQRAKHSELITKYKKQIDLMQEYKTSLISKAVTGKIDVREWQPKQTIKETV
ncbi:MAG: hypothetical protein EOM59_12040 [Clostridia bacterium]|nr:hypothetical protein [Clostridia bacterium]